MQYIHTCITKITVTLCLGGSNPQTTLHNLCSTFLHSLAYQVWYNFQTVQQLHIGMWYNFQWNCHNSLMQEIKLQLLTYICRVTMTISTMVFRFVNLILIIMLWAYISGKSLMSMLQLLHIYTNVCTYNEHLNFIQII